MTMVPGEIDPAIGEHVVAIRNRFGLSGLRDARRLIDAEIAIFQDAYDRLSASDEEDDLRAPGG